MPTRVKISFPQDEKTITVERDVAENSSIAQEIKGWDRGRIQKILRNGAGNKYRRGDSWKNRHRAFIRSHK